jgi:hypothetical protein
MTKRTPGFYWTICRPGGRWEVIEFDGVAWLGGNGDDTPIHRIDERIDEPTDYSRINQQPSQ